MIAVKITIDFATIDMLWMELKGVSVNNMLPKEQYNTFVLPLVLIRDVPNYIITRLVSS